MRLIEEDSISAAEPYARGFWISLLATVAVLFVLMLRPEVIPAPVLAGLLLVGALITVICSFGVLRKGSQVRLRAGGWLVLVYLLGGVGFDICATVVHTPDLADEMNVVARKLLDSGFSVLSVYVFAGVMQTLDVLMMASCWVGFVRHRETYLNSCFESATDSLFSFIKAATGGGKLSWRAYLFPMRMSEAPSFYHLFWLMIPMNIGAATYRWYLGLEWFGVVPYFHRAGVQCSISVIAALGVYVAWLVREFKRHKCALQS